MNDAIWDDKKKKKVMEDSKQIPQVTDKDESSDNDEFDIDFNSSKLGTKDHWNETYKNELQHFNENGDIGDIWFGEESVIRVIDWIKSSDIPFHSKILDIGCGNGITLSYLADEGYTNLYGVDYCEKAITLAKAIAEKRETPIHYEVGNVLDVGQIEEGLLKHNYDVCHDKGTFDAVCLCPHNVKEAIDSYMRGVNQLLVSQGIFIITSCNWTESELIYKFRQYFKKEATIPTPLFQFGGKIGSSVSSVVFRKMN